jgi:hypothetical protein
MAGQVFHGEFTGHAVRNWGTFADNLGTPSAPGDEYFVPSAGYGQ